MSDRGVRTAGDMPVGSQVHARGTLWTKEDPSGVSAWLSEDGYRFNDGQIDLLLGMGGTIMFIPAGAGKPKVQR